MSNNKCLISLLNKAAEKHYVLSLSSAGFPNSVSASCSSICTQILVSLFSSITNAGTAALPGSSARAKLRLLRLMMAGTKKVDEPQTSAIAADRNNSQGKPTALAGQFSHRRSQHFILGTVLWHPGTSLGVRVRSIKHFPTIISYFLTTYITCNIPQCIQIWCNRAKNNFKRLFSICRKYSLPTHWINVLSTHQN